MIEPITHFACELLRSDREKLWSKATLLSCASFLGVVSNTEAKDLLNKNGRNSVPYFIQHRSGILKVRDLNEANLSLLSRYLTPENLTAM